MHEEIKLGYNSRIPYPSYLVFITCNTVSQNKIPKLLGDILKGTYPG